MAVATGTILAQPAQKPAADTKSRNEKNLAFRRATWTSSSADFLNTGQMATNGLSWREWHSDKADTQWIYVDLGAVAKIWSVVLRWGASPAQAYQVQVSSDDGTSAETGLVENWRSVQQTTNGKGGVEEISLPETKARYVRILMTAKSKPEGYSLKAFEVYGKGGGERPPLAVPPPEADSTLRLSGGWRLIDRDEITDGAAAISKCGYDDSKWIAATVPGTVLTSYLNAGAIPDPFYGDNNKQISDFFAYTGWWYRNELELPSSYAGRRVWLNFGGINYRAYIYVNGSLVGDINGAFIRGQFDVTKFVMPGEKNCIAVLVMPVPKPGTVVSKRLDYYEWPWDFPKNEPTFLESDSWDWLPTIHDRNTGIWNQVTVTSTGDVTVRNPFVSTHFPEFGNLSRADLTLKLDLQNYSGTASKGELKVRLGDIEFTRTLTLDGGEIKHLVFDKSSVPALSMRNPKLWWPNGSGEQNLYDLTIEFRSGGKLSDVHRSQVGIREFTYERPSLTEWDVNKITNNVGATDKESEETLQIYCNGQRIFARGVNWGMDEGMLRCDRKGFDWRLRMEKEMNFNLIRNNAGNVDKDEFFELCDKYGLMVWEEFGISTGAMPDDPGMWLANARDRFLRRRNHACVVLWCTANETLPKDPILTEMPKMAKELDGTRMFLHCSTQTPPTNGDGPYDSRPASFYFRDFARGFRPEIGSPAIPAVESMERMMPHDKLWPINEMWALHDWWQGGGWFPKNGLCGTTEAAIAAYGEPKGIKDFCRKAQMVNMEVFKAIYESWNDRMWNDCSGVMVWMSNPAWPSLIWNLYDYYGDATAAYFACRKACEPVHIQWNAANNQVKVVNHSFEELKGLSAEATIYNLDGSVAYTQSAHLDCPANSVRDCMELFASEESNSVPLTGVHFIRLALKDGSGKTLSTNFYWRGLTEWKYEALEGMQQVRLTGTAGKGKNGRITVDLKNPTSGIALMVRIKLVDAATGKVLLPVIYTDNYFSLAPKELKHIEIDTMYVKPARAVKLLVEGWNIIPEEIIPSFNSVTAKADTSVFSNFITRNGDRLMDGDSLYTRFLSIQTPYLNQLDSMDAAPDASNMFPNEFEIRDELNTVLQMGGNTTRMYTLSFQNNSTPAYVTGIRTYNEDAFRTMDKILQIANETGVRLIIPFIDAHDFPGVGGISQMCSYRGEPVCAFWTDATLKQDYKNFVYDVLNRTNYYTGVKYKDDKAVLAWQLGNELQSGNSICNSTYAWESEMAAYVKSIDPNHLVMAGADSRCDYFNEQINDSNIDIVEGHYYTYWSGRYDLDAWCNTERNITKGKKPLIISEFGMSPTENLNNLEQAIINNGTLGGILWAMVPHSRFGGFYCWPDGGGYYEYHWPGFPSGAGYDETKVLNDLRDNAYAIRGLSVPPVPVPAVPALLPIAQVSKISWQGSTGAQNYTVERTTNPNGYWSVVGTNVTDDKESTGNFTPLFEDTTAEAGKNYYYRVIANNASGSSAPSNVVGPVTGSTTVSFTGNNQSNYYEN